MDNLTSTNSPAIHGDSASETIILVHGLWYRGWSMGLVARRLRAAGFITRQFSYPTVADSLNLHAKALREFVGDSAAPVHLLGYSMGGLVVLRMLDEWRLPAGRVVLMGVPAHGSRVAAKIAQVPGLSKLLGQASGPLQSGYPVLPQDREVGLITGTVPVGLGRVTGMSQEPNDGTVSVSEALLQGASAHLQIASTHVGMLASREAAEQAGYFFRHGKFAAEGTLV